MFEYLYINYVLNITDFKLIDSVKLIMTKSELKLK